MEFNLEKFLNNIKEDIFRLFDRTPHYSLSDLITILSD
jgi:hypothetical protein